MFNAQSLACYENHHTPAACAQARGKRIHSRLLRARSYARRRPHPGDQKQALLHAHTWTPHRQCRKSGRATAAITSHSATAAGLPAAAQPHCSASSLTCGADATFHSSTSPLPLVSSLS
eukprot:COSAG06_NODE_3252_length_5612_cov_786.685652_3_plen_119_part_00